jgi:hypothetical protein
MDSGLEPRHKPRTQTLIKSIEGEASLGQTRLPPRSTSICQSALVGEATDGGTELPIQPSPNISYVRRAPRDENEVEEYGESIKSGMTEKEMQAEARSRRVTFRDDLSQRSEGHGWATTTESGLGVSEEVWDLSTKDGEW